MRNIAIASFLCFSQLAADPPTCITAYAEDFFTEPYISEALSLHMVYQNQWELIKVSLERKMVDFNQRIDARAKALSPNPLEPPIDKVKAADVLNQVLLEMLEEALSENYYTDFEAAKRMFAFLQQKHKVQFVECLGEKSYHQLDREPGVRINLEKEEKQSELRNNDPRR